MYCVLYAPIDIYIYWFKSEAVVDVVKYFDWEDVGFVGTINRYVSVCVCVSVRE